MKYVKNVTGTLETTVIPKYKKDCKIYLVNIIVILLIIVIAFFLWYFLLQVLKPNVYTPHNDDIKQAYFYLWVIIYSQSTIIMGSYFTPLAKYIVEWENLKYQH